MHRVITRLFWLSALTVSAAETGAQAIPVSLADLAAQADLVVLAQVRDTDYLTRRDIPVSGSAYLKVLVPYKTGSPADLIEVYERGLHPNECYFPTPGVFEEGRRFLLFLARDTEVEGRYRGMPQGCALEVLVASDNRYALRYPVTGIELSDPISEFAREMSFSDGYAVVDAAELPPGQRDAMIGAGLIRPLGDGQWAYSRGVSLTTVRELMGRDQLLP